MKNEKFLKKIEVASLLFGLFFACVTALLYLNNLRMRTILPSNLTCLFAMRGWLFAVSYTYTKLKSVESTDFSFA